MSSVKKQIALCNKLGLHARAAARLIAVTTRFQSDIQIANLTRETRYVDGKSILSLMMLAAGCGHELDIQVAGDDAEAALSAIEAVILQRFDEAD